MITTALFWAIHIQVQAKNTLTALDPFGAVDTGITYWRTSEQAQAWPEKQSPDLPSQLQPRHGYTYLEQLMVKTQVPTHLGQVCVQTGHTRVCHTVGLHTGAEQQLVRKCAGGLNWNKLTLSQMCAPEEIKKASGILGCFRKSNPVSQVMRSFLPAQHWWCLCRCWAQVWGTLNILEWSDDRTQTLEHILHKERLRELELFHLKKRSLRRVL